MCVSVIIDLIPDARVATDEIKEEDEELQAALAASMESTKFTKETTQDDSGSNNPKEEDSCSLKRPAYPPLPEEPKADRKLICRIGLRLPDGRRVQRNFLRSDPIQVRFHAETCVVSYLLTDNFVPLASWIF